MTKREALSYSERRLSDGTTAALGTRPDARQSHDEGPGATEVPVCDRGAPEREERPSCGSTVADALRILSAKPGESLVDACRRVVSEGIRRELRYEAQLQAARLHAELSDAALAAECETAAAALADAAALRERRATDRATIDRLHADVAALRRRLVSLATTHQATLDRLRAETACLLALHCKAGERPGGGDCPDGPDDDACEGCQVHNVMGGDRGR